MVMAILSDEQQKSSSNNDRPNLIFGNSSTYAEVLLSSDIDLKGEESHSKSYKCSIAYEPVGTVDFGSVHDDTVDSGSVLDDNFTIGKDCLGCVDFGSVHDETVDSGSVLDDSVTMIGKDCLGCVNFGSVFDETVDTGSESEDTVDIGPASLDSVNFGSTYTDDSSVDKRNSGSFQGFIKFCHCEGVPRTKMKSELSLTFLSGSEEVCKTMRERHHNADFWYGFKTQHQGIKGRKSLTYDQTNITNILVTSKATYERIAGRTVLLPWMKDLIHRCSDVIVLPGKSFRGIVKVIIFLALFSFGFADSGVNCNPRRIFETAELYYKNRRIEALPNVTSMVSFTDVTTNQVSTHRRNFTFARHVEFTWKSCNQQRPDVFETEFIFFLFMTTGTIYFVVIGTLLMQITLSDQCLILIRGILKGRSSLMNNFVFRQDNSLEIEIVDGESSAVSNYLLQDGNNLKTWAKDIGVSAVDNEGVKIKLHGTPVSTISTQDKHFAIDSLNGSFRSIQDKYSMTKEENDRLHYDEFVVPDTANKTYLINDDQLYSEEHLIDIRNERVQPFKPSDLEPFLSQLGSENEEDEIDFDIDYEMERISKKRQDAMEGDSGTLDNLLECANEKDCQQYSNKRKHSETLEFSVNEMEETSDNLVFIPSDTSVVQIEKNKSDIKTVENKAVIKTNKLMVKATLDSCLSASNIEDVSETVDNFVTNKTFTDNKESIFKKSKYKVRGEEPRRRYVNTDAAYSEQEFKRIIMVRDYTWLPIDKLPAPHIDITTVTVGFAQDFPPLMFIIDQIAIGKPPAPHVSMRYELLRFCTLRSYPKEDKPYLIKLAEAGFYYASDGDGVVCYCCGIRRYNWTADDQPMKIHKRINPTCKFLVKNEEVNVRNNYNGPFSKELMAIDSIPELVESQEPSEDINNDWAPERTRSPAPRVQNNESTGTSNQLGINTAIPKHSQYATKTSRLASFSGWPDTASHTPDVLADAGFFYAGFGDCVRCFYCGIGLRHWTQDDNPWIEHARWAKNCVFVKQKKGEEFVNLVQLAVQYSQDNAPEENSGGNQLSPQEIENVLLSDAAQSVLDMGYQPRIIKKAVEQIIRQNRQAKITAQFLMEKILEIEEGSNETPGTLVSPGAATSTVGATGIIEGATGSSLKESLKESAEPEKKNKGGKPEDKKSSPTKEKIDKEKIITKSNIDVSKDKDPTSQQDPKAIKAENEQLKEQTICKICLDQTVSIVFLPCGHLVTCADCAPAMRKCPICRALVKGTVRTYMS